jgi:hypothetical protein
VQRVVARVSPQYAAGSALAEIQAGDQR